MRSNKGIVSAVAYKSIIAILFIVLVAGIAVFAPAPTGYAAAKKARELRAEGTFETTALTPPSIPVLAESGSGMKTPPALPAVANVTTQKRLLPTAEENFIAKAANVRCTAGKECSIKWVARISARSPNLITSYEINYGDGKTESKEFVNKNYLSGSSKHTYANEGKYSFEVVVKNTAGRTTSATATVEVKAKKTVNKPPVAEATADSTCNVNELCSFDGSGSYDADGNIAAYNWRFGDGSESTEATATHTYTKAGAYNVLLTVKDDKDAQSTISKVVTVAGVSVVEPVRGVVGGPSEELPTTTTEPTTTVQSNPVLKVESKATDSVKLSWTAPTGIVSGYKVYKRMTGTSTWGFVGTAEKTATSFNVSGLNPSTSYDFQIVAIRTSGGTLATSNLVAETTTVPSN